MNGIPANDEHPSPQAGEMRLEVVVVPVSDVDRARQFYMRLGWHLDADYIVDEFRVAQLTPPGSACSIIIGTEITSGVPGSLQGLQLAVADIDEARADLTARGIAVSAPFHDIAPGHIARYLPEGAPRRAPGPDPDRRSYGSFASFSDPDGNG